MSTETNGPLQQLEIAIRDTTALSVKDKARIALVETLKTVAERIPTAVEYARTVEVNSEDDANSAAASREVMAESAAMAEKALREFDDKLIERLFRTHRQWTALISVFTDPLNASARTVKSRIIAWQEAEQEKARKEQERLQAEADEKARKERERMEKQAEKLKTPELKEQRLEAAAQIVAPQITVAAPKPVVKTQRRWIVDQVDKAKFLEAAAKDPNLHGFIEFNMQALTRSKAANSALNVPGVTFKQVIV